MLTVLMSLLSVQYVSVHTCVYFIIELARGQRVKISSRLRYVYRLYPHHHDNPEVCLVSDVSEFPFHSLKRCTEDGGYP